MSVSAPRRLGQIVTGLGALVVLLGLVGGAPIALLAFAGNPLPDHLPTLAEIGTALTSRDDGQLFLRALAVVGWLGWATFALSVLVELPARLTRRPAPRLPGMRRQQRMAAALIGSAALLLVASPATAAVAATTAPAAAAQTGLSAAMALAKPAKPLANPAWSSPPRTTTIAPVGYTLPPSAPAVARFLPVAARSQMAFDEAEPRYQVERGDYLGQIADRYLGEFGDYPELAKLNKIKNPDQIYPGQLIRLPDDAVDRGYRPHASGMVITGPDGEIPGEQPPAPQPPAPPAPQQPAPQQPIPQQPGPPSAEQPAQPPSAEQPRQPGTRPSQPGQPGNPPGQPETPAPPPVDTTPPADRLPLPQPEPPVFAEPLPPSEGGGPTMAASAPGDDGIEINRPLAVSAVIAAASIVGAQVGTVFGLRRRPAGTATDGGRHRADPD